MKPLITVGLLLAVLTLFTLPAVADDEPVFADGGSLVTPLDGGYSVVVDLGAAIPCWKMAIRCEGAQATRYKLCTTSTCSVTSANQLLDSDRTYDLPVNCVAGVRKHFLGLKQDDAGVPSCKVQTVK